LKGKPDALNDVIIEAAAGELLFRTATGHVTDLVLINLPPLRFELDVADS